MESKSSQKGEESPAGITAIHEESVKDRRAEGRARGGEGKRCGSEKSMSVGEIISGGRVGV